jgi:predicted RNase H-like HicB family nuclease
VILTGTITNPGGSYSHIESEGDTYEEARENLYALLEEGQNLITIRKEL